jgi:outer membrane protein TolC
MARAAAVAACALVAATAVGAAESAGGWSLSLDEALELALVRHPELGVAHAALQVERADSSAAGAAAHRPELGALFEQGGEDLGSGDDRTIEVGLTKQFEAAGQRSARKELAAARARAARSELDVRAQSVLLGVRAAFRRALLLEERLVRLSDLAALDRSVADAAEARVRDGSLTPFGGRMSRLDFVRAEAARLVTERELRQARLALATAIGADLGDSTRLEGTLAVDTLAIAETDAVAIALAARREAETLRLRVDERRAAHALTVREGRPNLSLGAGVVFEKQELAGLHDDGRLWRIEASVPLPLGSPNRAAQARAEAEVALAQAEAAGFETRTRLETIAAVRRFRDASTLYRLHRDLAPRVRDDLVLVREAYSDGRISLDTYLTEKGRLADAVRAELESADEYVAALDALESVSGVDLERLNAGGRP